MTSIHYKSAFYFVLGTVFGCGGHEMVSRLLGW